VAIRGFLKTLFDRFAEPWLFEEWLYMEHKCAFFDTIGAQYPCLPLSRSVSRKIAYTPQVIQLPDDGAFATRLPALQCPVCCAFVTSCKDYSAHAGDLTRQGRWPWRYQPGELCRQTLAYFKIVKQFSIPIIPFRFLNTFAQFQQVQKLQSLPNDPRICPGCLCWLLHPMAVHWHSRHRRGCQEAWLQYTDERAGRRLPIKGDPVRHCQLIYLANRHAPVNYTALWRHVKLNIFRDHFKAILTSLWFREGLIKINRLHLPAGIMYLIKSFVDLPIIGFTSTEHFVRSPSVNFYTTRQYKLMLHNIQQIIDDRPYLKANRFEQTP
jgi:hypothetical protein